jgi:hypothetical protein
VGAAAVDVAAAAVVGAAAAAADGVEQELTT